MELDLLSVLLLAGAATAIFSLAKTRWKNRGERREHWRLAESDFYDALTRLKNLFSSDNVATEVDGKVYHHITLEVDGEEIKVAINQVRATAEALQLLCCSQPQKHWLTEVILTFADLMQELVENKLAGEKILVVRGSPQDYLQRFADMMGDW